MRIDLNPYVWHRVSLDLFYGRDALVKEIVADLKSGRSSAIVGGRKFGKTTVLRKIENDLELGLKHSSSSGLLMLPVYIDTLGLAHPLTPKTIYLAIIAQLENRLAEVGLLGKSHVSRVGVLEQFPMEENRAFAQIIRDFTEALAKMHFFQLIVLLDEVEPITKAKWADGFFSNWRHLLSNEPEISPHISVVFSGAKEIAALGEEIGSPLLNILTVHELSLFSYRDSERLANEPTGGILPDGIARKVFVWSGGHPFLIQYLMQYVCRFDTNEARSRLIDAKKHFLRTQGGQFAKWWFEKFSHNDRDVYIYLAERRRPATKREVIELVGDNAAHKSLSVLCHTGVAKKREAQERYRVAGEMFRQWVGSEGAVSSGQSACDRSIYARLRKLDPEIAIKYVSAWSIHSASLPNYSGAVSEMRDVVTLVLHKLAPDDQVISHPGFVPERDSSGRPLLRPTRKQRFEYVVVKRIVTTSSSLFSEIEALDSLTDQLGRMVTRGYGEASARTHKLATSEQAWRCLKQLDSILAQLL